MSEDCCKVFMVLCRKKLEYYPKESSFRTRSGNISYHIYRPFFYIGAIYIYCRICYSREQKMNNNKNKKNQTIQSTYSTRFFHYILSLALHKNITLFCTKHYMVYNTTACIRTKSNKMNNDK